jgi:glutamate 5-kinase
VPIINENDTISVEEIGFGENDGLAALVANLVSADMLILLTVVDGLYENPDAPAEARRAIRLVPKVTDEIRALANGSRSRGGRGGMVSKIQAADVATNAGGLALIANALQPRVLERIFDGEELGTLFLPAKGPRLTRRKSWIRFGSRPKGMLVVDAGARRALVEAGRSLLPSGIVRVEGEFDAGGLVAVCDEKGAEFARGLANYGAENMRKIMRLKTPAIHALFGDHAYDEAIHRDHLVLSE